MGRVRLRYRDKRREYSPTNEPERDRSGREWCRKMEQSSYQTTRHHIPENIMIYGQCCGNLKFKKNLIIFRLNWNLLLPWIREIVFKQMKSML